MKKQLETVADVESAMNELQRTEAQLASEASFANAKIADIRDGVIDKISPLEEKAKRIRTSIETWAEGNRDDEEIFPKGKKTFELQAGTISFRMGAEKVVLKKGVKTKDVVVRALEFGFKNILSKPDPELDKSAVKDLVESGKITEGDLRKLGLEITQDETLKIDLNKLESYT